MPKILVVGDDDIRTSLSKKILEIGANMPAIIKNVTLPIDTKDAPSVGLFVMAKNAEVVVGRLLDCVLPYVSGLSLVLNDTTDATLDVVKGRMQCHREKQLDVHHVTSVSHPQFYFQDERASYEQGTPLDGESFGGPFTEAPLLCDWAGARNVGWHRGLRCDYKLFLDVDDVVADPESIPALAKLLASARVDLAATRYVFGRGPQGKPNSVSYRERLARNTPDITWRGATHEVLDGGLRRVLVEDRLVVTDMKDNWGRGVRVPGRCFKVLYRQARLADWKVTTRHLAYLVQECPGMMPVEWVAGSLLPVYLAKAPQPEEEAWVLCMVGEMWEARRGFKTASLRYLESTARFPTAKAYFRLCRALYQLREWRACAESFECGRRLANKATVLDDGPVYADSSKILAAQAYHELSRQYPNSASAGGDRARAVKLAREAAATFPTSKSMAAVCDAICGGGT